MFIIIEVKFVINAATSNYATQVHPCVSPLVATAVTAGVDILKMVLEGEVMCTQ